MADNEQESTNQKVSKILLTIVLLLLIIVILVGIFFGGKVINKAKLDNEIKEVASKNIESDDFSNIQVASSGEYAIVERAIKEFYRDYVLLDLALNYKFFKHYILTFSINNLLNTNFLDYRFNSTQMSYVNAYQRHLPGRNYWISLRVEW